MTTSTSTHTFETVQHFDQRTDARVALDRHKAAEAAAGITGERGYLFRAENGAKDYVIESYPPGARKAGLWFDDGEGYAYEVTLVQPNPECPVCNGDGTLPGSTRGTLQPCDRCGATGTDPEGIGLEDFPCCGPNGEGH